MTPLTQDDLLSHAEYETQRQNFRQRIIALKKRRRIGLGNLVTMVFENRETIQFQIQEMIRVERIFDSDKIQEELDVYNVLIPEQGGLSATLFIEITEDEQIKPILDTFQNLDRDQTLAIHVGTQTVFAEFEPGHSKEDKISAVHFIRFRPDPGWITALRTETSPVMTLVQETHSAEAKVPAPMRDEWLKDLVNGL